MVGYGGAGIALWAHQVTGGAPVRLLTVHMAICFSVDSVTAEAFGGRLCLAVLLDTITGRQSARIVGDNLPVARYGSNSARLRRTHMHMLLGDSIAAVIGQGWRTQWYAVRNALNTEAHRLAAAGSSIARNTVRTCGLQSGRVDIFVTVDMCAVASGRSLLCCKMGWHTAALPASFNSGG